MLSRLIVRTHSWLVACDWSFSLRIYSFLSDILRYRLAITIIVYFWFTLPCLLLTHLLSKVQLVSCKLDSIESSNLGFREYRFYSQIYLQWCVRIRVQTKIVALMRKSVPATAGKIVMTSFHVSKSKTVETKNLVKFIWDLLSENFSRSSRFSS